VSDAVRAVFVWWTLVLATRAVPDRPVCRRCGVELPDSPTGRRCRRDVCRPCENAAYYLKLRRLQPGHLRELWRESKRRIRAKE
jgi:hypothetical protein